eukprot:TRINITY_DN5621_c0_g1_i9.p1 TRINITY_DN5621_c0_g1~~TRINITY_DN5621_c0_g1_i9.p1  ORF type:complete len:446 (-),score=122.90 TRINITY_DN5621_c0_g1_i9:64-1401(-)
MKKRVGPYILQELIAKCSCGEVYKSFSDEANSWFAVKMLRKDEMNEKEVTRSENELNILQMLQHENVVQLCDVKKSAHHYYIVLEYYEGCTLSEYVKKKGRLGDIAVRVVLRQIISALNSLYQLPAAHCNLTSSKVLLTNLHNPHPLVKLTGFRLSQLGKNCGPFCAGGNNVVSEDQRDESYTQADDIQSLGAIVYQMVTGQELNGRGKYRIDPRAGTSAEALDFISRAVQGDAGRRSTWEEVLGHPLVAGDKATEFDFERFAAECPVGKDSLGFIELDPGQQYDFMRFPLAERLQSMKLQSLGGSSSNEEEKKQMETPNNSPKVASFPEPPAKREKWGGSGSSSEIMKRSIVYSIKDNWIKEPTIPKKHVQKKSDNLELTSRYKKYKEENSEDVENEGGFEILDLDSLVKPMKKSRKKVKDAENDFSVKLEGNISIADEHFMCH